MAWRTLTSLVPSPFDTTAIMTGKWLLVPRGKQTQTMRSDRPASSQWAKTHRPRELSRGIVPLERHVLVSGCWKRHRGGLRSPFK